MIKENGIVTRILGDTTWVKTVRSSECEGCSSQGMCDAAKEGEVEALNTVGAEVGDAVVVGFETGSFVKISLLLYIVPVIAMIIGAVLGSAFAKNQGLDETVFSALFCFSFLFIAFLVIRLTGNRLAGDNRYQARIIRIRKVFPAADGGPLCAGKTSMEPDAPEPFSAES